MLKVTHKNVIYEVEETGPKMDSPCGYSVYPEDMCKLLMFGEPTGKERMAIIKKYKNEKRKLMSTINIPCAAPACCPSLNSLESMDQPIPLAPAGFKSIGCFQTPKRSTNMYNEMQIREVTDESRKVDILLGELHDAMDDKRNNLRLKYGIDQTYPKNRAELAAWLKEGKYIIDGLDKLGDEEVVYWNIRDKIRFTSVPKDQKGYDVAYEMLMATYNKARVQIQILPPADGLKILEAFQAS